MRGRLNRGHLTIPVKSSRWVWGTPACRPSGFPPSRTRFAAHDFRATGISERDEWGQRWWGPCNFLFFWQRDFLGTPVNLLLSSQSATAYLFVHNLSKMINCCSGPISVDPICPQPRICSALWGKDGKTRADLWGSRSEGLIFKVRVSNLRSAACRNLGMQFESSKLQSLGPCFQIECLRTTMCLAKLGGGGVPGPAKSVNCTCATSRCTSSSFSYVVDSNADYVYTYSEHVAMFFERGREKTRRRGWPRQVSHSIRHMDKLFGISPRTLRSARAQQERRRVLSNRSAARALAVRQVISLLGEQMLNACI